MNQPITKIYVAINKETGGVMSGANGQYGYGDTASLNRSLAYSYKRLAREKGVKARELYSIYEIDVAAILPKEGAE